MADIRKRIEQTLPNFIPRRILEKVGGVNESNDKDGHKNIFNRGGDNRLHGGGVLSLITCHGSRLSDGVRQYELFTLAREIFYLDAGDCFNQWTLCADLVYRGKIFI